ncbi:MAG: HAMP domain-containing histidine kinase [Gemmatimonadota bacterium]|nr:HAMP domain-containing histidine kinase [Gemmatimonadota bacterium]
MAPSILRNAVADLAATLDRTPASPPEMVYADVRDELSRLHGVLEAVLAGADASEAAAPLGRPVLTQRLIAALRKTLLAGGNVQSDQARDTLAILRCLEDVHDALSSGDPDELQARLSEPDAFELLAEIAHDLRSPLSSILFLSETLRGGTSGEVNQVQHSQLGLIYGAAFGLTSLASDIMDLAGRGEGLIEAEPVPFSLGEVFQGVERMLQPLAEEKKLDLTFHRPEYDRTAGHPHALGRILLNLTSNALKFTERGCVEVGVNPKPMGRMEYFVQDTGRGIPDEVRRELFQSFKKRDTQDRHFFSSSGVGLSIARRLIRAMGSDLEVTSVVNVGTRFSFVVQVPRVR